MLRSPFFRRLFVPYLILLCAATAAVGIFAGLRFRDRYLEDRKHALYEEMLLISDIITRDVSAGRTADLNKRIQQLGSEVDSRITIIAEDGTVLADSEANAAEMENHAGRPEIIEARKNGQGGSIRNSATVHQEFMYTVREMRGDGGKAYFLRLAMPLRQLNQDLRVLYVGLAAVGLIAVGCSAAIVFHFARRNSAPVLELTSFADALSRGHLERRTHLSSRETGEIGTLGSALNEMASSMQQLLSQAEHDKVELLTILSSMSEGIIATDEQQRIVVVNDAAGQLLGFPTAEARGKPLWQVLRIERLIKAADEALESGGKKGLELGWVGTRFIEVSLCPYPATGKRQGMVLVAHDMTQSIRYEELRKEFVANVSHELRTPLTVIRGFIETLRDGAMADPQKGPEYLATIERHANQLTNLVNDLLELSRIESQPDLPRRISVDIAAVARKAIDLLTPAAQKKQHELAANLQQVPLIVGDPDYIERGIANLIDNAIKYTPAGGRIAVSTHTVDSTVIVEVVDNGIGIPQADLPRIFERFYRVDRSRSREMGGTGLGLAIVKHIAQVHGGSIEVRSTSGQGSTFRMRFPLPPR